MSWPPDRDAWPDFLVDLWPQVASYKRFEVFVGNVCEVANRHWSRVMEKNPAAIDPRILYEQSNIEP